MRHERSKSLKLGQALLAEARAGSLDSLGRLLDGLHRVLRFHAKRLIAADIQSKFRESDLVQETIQDALRDFSLFSGNSESDLIKWLLIIMHNNAEDQYRRYRRCQSRQLQRETPLCSMRDEDCKDLQSRDESPEEVLIRREDEHRLALVVERLQPVHRHIYRLCCELGYSDGEVAKLSGSSPSSIRRLRCHVLREVQKNLETARSQGSQAEFLIFSDERGDF